MISLRLTTIEDVDILTDIQQKAFQPLYEKYHDEGNPCLRDKRDILCRLDNPKFLYLTILFDDKIVGGSVLGTRKSLGGGSPLQAWQ